MKNKFTTIVLLLLCVFATSQANNVQTANVLLTNQNSILNYSLINFDISWENSWRTASNEANYDGCWVFVKFRKHGTSSWQHATLNTTGHTVPTGSTITTPTDGKGVFMYRDANGIGNVNFTGAQLQWNYGADGLSDNDSVEIKVCAIEMAYIPEGAFYVGSGGGEFNTFYKYDSITPSNINTPYLVANAGSIAVGSGDGKLKYADFYNTGYPNYYPGGGDGLGPIPITFPTGYESFWVMKYECSQQQYTDFLNLLDATRAANRKSVVSPITGTFPTYTAPNPEYAIQVISTQDLLAYADWAGMRPMTELEYEKACRGANNLPIPTENAWGNTTLNTTSTLLNTGMNNEVSAIANANYFASGGTRRCGMFATATSDRIASGGTYYGVMDMSGNVDELAVTVGTPINRMMNKNIHGDGSINAVGNSDESNWTGISVMERGGHNGGGNDKLKTSMRFFNGGNFAGIRLVRNGN
jgi:formylglycine-generating enzyme required for sulfatase activity